MAMIMTETTYKATMERIEELLPLVNEDTPSDDRNLIELELLSNLVSNYDDEHFPIASPTLIHVVDDL